MYANGGTDLEDGNGVDVVSLFFQSACQSVAELYGFFIIVAICHADVVIGNICLFLCKICSQQIDIFIYRLAAASADTGGEDFSLF